MNRLTMLVLAMLAGMAVATTANAGEHKGGEGKGGGPGGHAERFAKADANGDGKLSLDEFKTFAKGGEADAKFTAADTDKDGFLTKEELKAAHAKGGPGKGHGGGDGKGECPKADKKDV
jgi:hypothetical protein